MTLKPPECIRHLGEGRTVAQCTGLALKDCEVMPPVKNGVSRKMRPVDAPHMLAKDLPLCCNGDLVRIDPDTDRAIGERSRNAVAVALKTHQTRR